MKAPDFWYRPPGLEARLLAPLGCAFDLAGRLRHLRARPVTLPVPLVCIGNFVAGGAGKTPIALAVAPLLEGWGLRPHFLSRGYGGRMTGPVLVAPDHHGAAEVGDEPLLLAKAAPTWVARDRIQGAAAALAAGARTLILDDGFQNPALNHRLSVVVVDGNAGFGNGCVIPAGPLRERAERGLARASALVILGRDRVGIGARLDAWTRDNGRIIPRFNAALAPEPAAAEALASQRLLAFAGIGRPAKFFDTCAELGAELIATESFPDHHPYRRDEVTALIARARKQRAVPVTTAKDWVRLPTDLRADIAVLSVTVTWHDPTGFARFLANGIGHHV